MQQNLPLRIYAHRGSNRIFPENTLEAFAQALEEQATHLEMDLRSTRDNHIVVTHDPDGKRVAGVDKSIRECSLAELQSWDLAKPFLALKHKEKLKENKEIKKPKNPEIREKEKAQLKTCRIPRFEEILDAFPKTPLNVDIKDSRPQIVEKIVQLIHQRKDEKRVLLNSFEDQVVRRLQSIPYRGETGISRWATARLRFSPPFLWRRLNIRGEALQIPPIWKKIKLDSPCFIRRCHTLQKRVDYWNINEAEETLRLLHLGADGIISDNLRAVREAVFSFARQKNKRLDYV